MKFTKSEESKDERGQKILLQSHKHSFAVFAYGWGSLEVIHRFIQPISFDTYRDVLWLIVLSAFIVYGFSIQRNRMKQ